MHLGQTMERTLAVGKLQKTLAQKQGLLCVSDPAWPECTSNGLCRNNNMDIKILVILKVSIGHYYKFMLMRYSLVKH